MTAMRYRVAALLFIAAGCVRLAALVWFGR